MRIQSQLDSFLRCFREIQRSLGEIQRVLADFQNSFKRLLPAIL